MRKKTPLNKVYCVCVFMCVCAFMGLCVLNDMILARERGREIENMSKQVQLS